MAPSYHTADVLHPGSLVIPAHLIQAMKGLALGLSLLFLWGLGYLQMNKPGRACWRMKHPTEANPNRWPDSAGLQRLGEHRPCPAQPGAHQKSHLAEPSPDCRATETSGVKAAVLSCHALGLPVNYPKLTDTKRYNYPNLKLKKPRDRAVRACFPGRRTKQGRRAEWRQSSSDAALVTTRLL